MKKYFYIICALLIVFLSILFIILVNVKKTDNKETESETAISVKGEDLSFELNDKIFPQNYLRFQNDTNSADIDYKAIYKALYKLVRGAEKINNDTSNLNDNEIDAYYTKNTSIINEMGIVSESDFNNLVKILGSVYSGNEVFYRNVKLERNETEGKYEVYIEYNNDKVVRLKMNNLGVENETVSFIPVIQ